MVGFERELLQEIEGQQIRLVIDRIDRLRSGEEAIIDYKTGKVQPGKWFGERPDDPQLPLYATSADKAAAAVVFSVIGMMNASIRASPLNREFSPGLPPRQRSDCCNDRGGPEHAGRPSRNGGASCIA